MILLPRPSGDPQTGGRWMDDSMEQFWKRRMLVDELASAPHLDRVMKIMDDTTQSKGRALPPSVPDYGLGSSDYFRSQRQLQQLQPLTVKSVFTDNKIMPTRSSRAPPLQGPTSTRPLMGHSFQEAIQRTQTIDQDLEAFRHQAKEDLAAAVKTGNNTQICEAQQRLAIVDRNIEEIKARDEELDQLEFTFSSKDNRDTYGEEDETDWREDKRKNLARMRDQRYRQLKRLYPKWVNFRYPRNHLPFRIESTRPPLGRNFQEAVRRSDAIERELQMFRTRAEDALARAEWAGNKADMKKAKQRLAIVNRNVDEVLDMDRKIDRLGYSHEAHRKTYGEDDDKARRQETLKSWEDRRDKLHRQLQKLFPKQRGRGRVWVKPCVFCPCHRPNKIHPPGRVVTLVALLPKIRIIRNVIFVGSLGSSPPAPPHPRIKIRNLMMSYLKIKPVTSEGPKILDPDWSIKKIILAFSLLRSLTPSLGSIPPVRARSLNSLRQPAAAILNN